MPSPGGASSVASGCAINQLMESAARRAARSCVGHSAGRRWLLGRERGTMGAMRVSDVPGVQDWLLRTRRVDDGGVSFMQGLVDELRGRGLPLWSCNFSLLTKHPEPVWRTVLWNHGVGVRTVGAAATRSRSPLSPRARSPACARASRSCACGSRRGRCRFPSAKTCARRARPMPGAGAARHRRRDRPRLLVTSAPGGFTDEALAALMALGPLLDAPSS